jgi:hypothetical protein
MNWYLILLYVLGAVGLIIVTMPVAILFTWILYLAIMNLQRCRDNGTLPDFSRKIGTPLLYVGLFNVIWITVLFVDLPPDWLITGRLKKYVHGPDGWRKNLAHWFAANMLDPFDPSGKHVK